jgi:hypothetical protein
MQSTATLTRELMSLDDRIANCFANAKNVSSKGVADVLAVAQASLTETKETAEKAKEHALSPKLTSKQVAEAKRAMEDAAFAVSRLEEAIPKLQTRLQGIRDMEAEISRRENYRRVKNETEKLAEQVAREYPVLLDKLVNLLERVRENEYQVKCVNVELPGVALMSAGKYDPNAFPPLQNADEIARGIADFEQVHFKKSGMTLNPSLPRLTESVRLPKTVAGYGYAFAWPAGPNLGPGTTPDYAEFVRTGRRAR